MRTLYFWQILHTHVPFTVCIRKRHTDVIKSWSEKKRGDDYSPTTLTFWARDMKWYADGIEGGDGIPRILVFSRKNPLFSSAFFLRDVGGFSCDSHIFIDKHIHLSFCTHSPNNCILRILLKFRKICSHGVLVICKVSVVFAYVECSGILQNHSMNIYPHCDMVDASTKGRKNVSLFVQTERHFLFRFMQKTSTSL